MTLQSASQSMTEPNIYILVTESFTLRIAVYVDNMLVGNEPTDEGRHLRASFIDQRACPEVAARGG